MNPDKVSERIMLLRRLLRDEDLYKLAKKLGISEASEYDNEYEQYLKSQRSFFMLRSEDKERLIEKIAQKASDEVLVEFFNAARPKDPFGVGFRGRYYVYDEFRGLRLENGWEEVKRDVFEALKITGERGYAFLKAIIDLHDIGKWKGDWYGASYSDILARMREILGRTVMPAPRDFAVLKSLRIYYKSGSRRYPTHSIPEEIIPAVKEALKEWIIRRKTGGIK
mgnify:CR=1 FL=1